MRHIQPKMTAFLDAKLAGNGLAQHAIAERDARLLFRLAAEACVGIREATGNNDGPMVELIQGTISGPVRQSWCMDLQQTCLAYAELKTGVASPLVPSEGCLDVWERTPAAQRVEHVPAPGAICIWRHGQTGNGHTGTVCDYGQRELKMHLVEGNTGGGVMGGAVVRNGDGCYYTERSILGTGDMRVVGFLKPF